MSTTVDTTPTDERVAAFLSMSVDLTLSASYHESYGRAGRVFLNGSVPAEYGPKDVFAILLDVDQAKALINSLTEAVTR